MYKKVVVFVCEIDHPFETNSLQSGLGGAETWILNMAFRFMDQNYHVLIFNQNDYSYYQLNGLEIYPISNLEEISSYVYFEHVFISRYYNPKILEIFKKNHNVHNIYYVVHDIRLWKNLSNNIDDLNSSLLFSDFKDDEWISKHLHKIFYMSDWHVQTNQFCGFPENLIDVIGNGINLPTIDPMINRDDNILWSSCIERGLDNILIDKIMPRIHKKLPNIKIYLASYNPLPESKYDSLGYIISLGSLSKDQLYQEMQKHKISFLPLSLWETFCITSIESVSNGMEFISPFKYGLTTTFKYFKEWFLKDGDFNNPEYCQYVADYIIDKIEKYNSPESNTKRNILREYIKDNYSWEKIFDKLYNTIKVYETSNCNN